MQQVKLFKSIESELSTLEEDINAWIQEAGAKNLQISGNIAPQNFGMHGAPTGGYAPPGAFGHQTPTAGQQTGGVNAFASPGAPPAASGFATAPPAAAAAATATATPAAVRCSCGRRGTGGTGADSTGVGRANTTTG